MRNLFIARTNHILEIDRPDIKQWGSISKMIGLNVSMVDRTGYLKMPVNFAIYQGFDMPSINSVTNLSYEECCDLRALEIIKMSDNMNKPIKVMYSGGIDSTLVLISLMKHIPQNELQDKLVVSLSLDSINENPNFYFNYIRNNLKIVSSDNFGESLDSTHLIVGGEHNDQLFGSDLVGKIYRSYDFTKINEPYSRNYIVGWFEKNRIDSVFANRWFDLIDDQIKTVNKCQIITNFDFFWWLNFCFKWQTVFFRILTRLDKTIRSSINQKVIDENFIHFYSSIEFQRWSMMNPEKKIITDWKDYKFESKKLIYEFNNDYDYFKNKVKIGSLYRLFVQHDSVEAITTDWDFIEERNFNPEEFYNPNNSFK